MDEHYDFEFARKWTYKAKKTPNQSNLGGQLEEWTNIRNTKNQYSKQLPNFLKVWPSNIWRMLTDIVKKRLIALKDFANQWKQEAIDAWNLDSKVQKILKGKRLFSGFKALCAIENCHQYANHSRCTYLLLVVNNILILQQTTPQAAIFATVLDANRTLITKV